MGDKFSKLKTKFGGKKNFRLLIAGFDDSGKTSILNQLKYLEFIKTQPTIGYNIEAIDYKGLNFTIVDTGGQDKIRVLWKHYYQDIDGLIFVMNSNERDYIDDNIEEIRKMSCEKELEGCPFLVIANKQDEKNAFPPDEIKDKFGDIKGRKLNVFGASAKTGEGIIEGFDWLVKAILEKNKKIKKK